MQFFHLFTPCAPGRFEATEVTWSHRVSQQGIRFGVIPPLKYKAKAIAILEHSFVHLLPLAFQPGSGAWPRIPP